ncbi:hypothetical protein PVAG01_04227 [Phlyctema vagabunda]|uniref:Uncharacterized protein n=1 Tax=Phlyctema vagabunda TaxID=108571 RepID=A0ABR4PNR2_9HELO
MANRISLQSSKRNRARHEDGQTSFELRLRRAQALQREVSSLRLEARRQREELRKIEQERAAADNDCFKAIRLWESQNIPPKPGHVPMLSHIQNLLNRCQSLRDEHGPLEHEFLVTEDYLRGKEFELERLEERLLKRQYWSSEMVADDSSSNTDGSTIMQTDPQVQGRHSSMKENFVSSASEHSQSTHSSFEFDIPQEYHPLVSKYLSKRGDLELVREQLWEYREERDDLEAEKETLSLVKKSLPQGDLVWLEEYDEREAEKLRELAELDTQVENLRKKCLEAGLIDGNGAPKDFDSQERNAFTDEADNLEETSEKSDCSKYPTLLGSPSKVEKKFSSSLRKTNPGSACYINDWMLHKLQLSPLEVNLLARIYQVKGGEMYESWQLDVLAYWSKDGTTKKATATETESSLELDGHLNLVELSNQKYERSISNNMATATIFKTDMKSELSNSPRDPNHRAAIQGSDISDCSDNVISNITRRRSDSDIFVLRNFCRRKDYQNGPNSV